MKMINNYGVFSKSDTILVACSGGVDSVVLCYLLQSEGYSFEIAHCNFQLRGDESDRDEMFVRQLGTLLNVKVNVIRLDTNAYALSNKLSIQLAARELRYNWFSELLENDSRLQCIATAHNANDNAETAAMNFFKGTGIAGLHGIPPVNGNVVRPLLGWTRVEIEAFAKEKNIKWVEDSSNATTKYTRNYFRHHVFPVVEKHFGSAISNVNDTISHLREVEMLYNERIDEYRKLLLDNSGEYPAIVIKKLRNIKAISTVLYEILKAFDFLPNQIPYIIELMDAQPGKYVLGGNYKIIKDRDLLQIVSTESFVFDNIVFDKNADKIALPNGQLCLNIIDRNDIGHFETNTGIAYLDADLIKENLNIRLWRDGDYFYPLGMSFKKKIARFLIDAKVSVAAKHKTFVLEHNGDIVWLVNYRTDNRYKVTSETKHVLVITFNK